MQNKDHEKLSNLIVYGGWLAGGGLVVGAVGFFFGFITRSAALMALMGLGGLAVVAGLGLVGYSVYTGLQVENADPSLASITEWPDTLIQARFATNAIGETVFSDMDIDFEDPQTKLYLQILTGSGRRAELKARQEVWAQAGEGMRGKAIVQGDWLVGFTPTIGTADTSPHLRSDS
jgi:hypothetical protein